jgi:hypothetical protein
MYPRLKRGSTADSQCRTLEDRYEIHGVVTLEYTSSERELDTNGIFNVSNVSHLRTYKVFRLETTLNILR